MNETWLKITDDPTTLPPIGEPVFTSFCDSKNIVILMRTEVLEDDEINWVWERPSEPYYQPDKKTWSAWDTEWDDDYNPTHWHPFPKDPPEVNQ